MFLNGIENVFVVKYLTFVGLLGLFGWGTLGHFGAFWGTLGYFGAL